MQRETEIINEANNRRHQIQEKILKWAEDNLRNFPWRENRTPYRILVAEFLLKRTTSTAVERVYLDFLKQYPNIKELIKTDVYKLENFLKAIGYHKLRARALKETAIFIVKEHSGLIPMDLEELMSIPNIGPYTAGAVLSIGYNKPAPMVDSNIERILRKVFNHSLPQRAVLKWLWRVASVLLPERKHATFNLALLDLGAKVCTYRASYCDKCPIANLCDSRKLK